MTETVKDVLHQMSEDIGIDGLLRLNPNGLMYQGEFAVFVASYIIKIQNALDAETENQKHCPYCHNPAEDDPASNLSDVIGTRMQIQTNGVGTPYITTWDFNGSESKQISFCPMCGRRLEEE